MSLVGKNEVPTDESKVKSISGNESNVISIESEDHIQSLKIPKERAKFKKEGFRPSKKRIRLTKKTARSKRPKIISEAPKFTQESMIGETNDLRPINFLIEGSNIQKAVCKVEVKAITTSGEQCIWYGTGFMISDDLLMTNHHVVPDANTHMILPNKGGVKVDKIIECNVIFNFQKDWANRLQNTTLSKFDLDFIYYVGNAQLDYSIFKINNCPGKEFGTVQLDVTTQVFEQTPVIIIQHPEGGVKQIALENNLVTRIKRDEKDNFPPYLVRYTTDTEEGSSGSPVFTPAWDLVALHHGNQDSKNEGTLVKKIIEDIVKKYQETELSNEMKKYLLACLINSNLPPEIMRKLELDHAIPKSFFGSLGLKIKDVVSGYDERISSKNGQNIEFIDLGYWSIDRVLKGGITVERIVLAASYAHDMGIDLWLIDRIPQDAIEKIEMVFKENYNQNWSYFLIGTGVVEANKEKFRTVFFNTDKLSCEVKELALDSLKRKSSIFCTTNDKCQK